MSLGHIDSEGAGSDTGSIRTSVELRSIVKRFGSDVLALDHVDLTIRPGQVLALLGENGSGKTTLMNILSGLIAPSSGEILIDGRPVKMRSARVASAHGIGMVHQHFMLVPPLTVAENVVLGTEPRHWLLDRPKIARQVTDMADRFGLHLDPLAKVAQLPVGLQQRVEIVKALYRGARVLILDEPTAVLTPQEADALLDTMRRMADQGRCIVFISHKLREVRRVSDRIVILRRGRVVDEVGSDASEQDLANAMVGRQIVLRPQRPSLARGAPMLQLVGLNSSGQPGLHGIDLTVCAGEIFGVVGVDGNGQLELEEVLGGLRTPTAGRILVDGTEVKALQPRRIRDLGVAHIPSDRQRRGLVAEASVRDNVRLGQHRRSPFLRRGLLNQGAAQQYALRLIESFDIRTTGPDQAAGTLSGGNQQKLIIARELSQGGRLVVASQPTRGVDVGATEFIYAELLKARAEGRAVLLITADLDEALALSDRIGVLYQGRLVGVTERADREQLGLWMAGVGEVASG